MLPFPPRIAALPRTIPFVGPERQERDRGGPFAARLGANENPFGPSPKAIAAMAEAARDVWQYGDPENHDLIEALAAHHGVPPSRISVGEGIDAILGNAVRLFTDDGTPIVSSAGAYPTFLYHVRAVGGRPHLLPYATPLTASMPAPTPSTGVVAWMRQRLCWRPTMASCWRLVLVAQVLALRRHLMCFRTSGAGGTQSRQRRSTRMTRCTTVCQ